ncbi:hypothetical protein C0J52_01209 [Blattella germanica]|nr:hypothetical protein C0J52_01209 [Blattella germanica]PSN50740.1 hypothetical protein C0J52_01209 [Blattella germanica]PSN50741.1 hypothetical protein C0J52_01209 [Blattella germanica]
MNNLPYVKWKKGKILVAEERQMVINVLNYMKERNPDQSLSWTVAETILATGVGYATIYGLRKEISKGPLQTPKVKKHTGPNRHSLCVKYGDDIRNKIRQKVNDCYSQGKRPTFQMVLELAKKDPGLSKLSSYAVRALLKKMNFAYEKDGYKRFLVLKEEAVST